MSSFTYPCSYPLFQPASEVRIFLALNTLWLLEINILTIFKVYTDSCYFWDSFPEKTTLKKKKKKESGEDLMAGEKGELYFAGLIIV